MTAYFLLIGVILIAYFITQPYVNNRIFEIKWFRKTHQVNRNQIFLFWVTISLILFAGLRSPHMGNDISGYLGGLHFYEGYDKSYILKAPKVYPYGYETLYWLLMKICAFFGFSDSAYLTLCAILIYTPVMYFINKYSEDSLISVMMYIAFFLPSSITILRQMIALGVLLMAYDRLIQKKYVCFFILIIIAFFIHRASILAIIILLLYKIGSKKLFWLTIVLELFVRAAGRRIVLFVLRFFPSYQYYVGSEYDISTGGLHVNLILLNVLFIIALIWLTRVEQDEKRIFENNFFFAGSSLAILTQAAGYSFGVLGRINLNFSLSNAIILPKVINRAFKEKSRIIARMLIVVFFIAYSLLTIYGDKTICPYISLFERP